MKSWIFTLVSSFSLHTWLLAVTACSGGGGGGAGGSATTASTGSTSTGVGGSGGGDPCAAVVIPKKLGHLTDDFANGRCHLQVRGGQIITVREGGLVKMPVTGGAGTKFASDPAFGECSVLALTGTEAFFYGDSDLRSIAFAGGPSKQVLADFDANALAVDPSWTRLTFGVRVDAHKRNLVALPTAGGTPKVLCNLPNDVRVEAIVDDGKAVTFLALGQTYGDPSQMLRCDGSGPPEVVVSLPDSSASPESLVSHAGYLYWVAGEALVRVPIGGGAAPEIVDTEVWNWESMHAGPSGVFYTRYAKGCGDATVMRLADGAASPAPFADLPGGVLVSLASDDKNLYILDVEGDIHAAPQ